MPIREWVDRALCLETYDPIFFPEQSVAPHIVNRKEKQAKELCAACTVSDECLADALRVSRASDVGGVRGGLTKDERDEYRKKHRLDKDPTWKPPRNRGSR